MSSREPTAANVEATEVCVVVSHAARKFQITLPAATATVGDIKNRIEQSTGVPVERQRLLFGAHTLKQYRNGDIENVRLIDIVVKPSGRANEKGIKAPAGTNDNPKEGRDDNSSSGNGTVTLTSGSVITLPVMLLGTAASAPHVDEEVTAQLHRLVTTTLEHDSRWFRCSYGKGYARQTAFVCRTCVDSGAADPSHAICYACAEVCHTGHDVEEWGVRYFMRCDCCTPVCWRDIKVNGSKEEWDKKAVNDHSSEGNRGQGDENSKMSRGVLPLIRKAEETRQLKRCCFILDSETSEPPVSREAVPLNGRNIYPRSSYAWCFCCCEDDYPPDGTNESAGVVCMLCATCFWSAHITRLHTGMLNRLPCHGNLVEGDVVAFYCETCKGVVCGPCRLRCHADHEVQKDVVVAPYEQHGKGAVANSRDHTFKCECGCFSSDKSAGDDGLNDRNASLLPPNTAVDIMNSDSLIGFICAYCMQEHPWLADRDYRYCYGGKLPDPVPKEQHKPIVSCNFPPDAECPDDRYPFHGMLFSVDAFTEKMTCKCAPCRQAYERFAPRTTTTAQDEMAVELHEACDHCGRNIRDENAFMCQTCELCCGKAFFVCRRCNSLRLGLNLPTPSSTNDESVHGNTQEGNTVSSTEQEDEPASWDHPSDHVFLEDTCENLFNLCGMCVAHHLGPQAEDLSSMDAESIAGTVMTVLQRTFGEAPLTFDPKDIAQHHQLLQQQKKKPNASANTQSSSNERTGRRVSPASIAKGCKRPRIEESEDDSDVRNGVSSGSGAHDGDDQI
ncbi:Ubiquitin family, putative [Trypanosoma equiperdum]|uniref:Ubiquitin-like domain-containing protein n=2 Tax=Trypanozoon TaxID=39700 RepID=Q38C18_TRYB2|nr:hypothetical protein, conserved [Trypanosoma brucei brucei TREU927]EAN77652.1 hypothetical protein, conserved [Trypanosoma brucei brucei TREU927]SCU67593.1 Ubiquitin family, putative [Trypanosoma equiperdum]